jgi:hypothetical protein
MRERCGALAPTIGALPAIIVLAISFIPDWPAALAASSIFGSRARGSRARKSRCIGKSGRVERGEERKDGETVGRAVVLRFDRQRIVSREARSEAGKEAAADSANSARWVMWRSRSCGLLRCPDILLVGRSWLLSRWRKVRTDCEKFWQCRALPAQQAAENRPSLMDISVFPVLTGVRSLILRHSAGPDGEDSAAGAVLDRPRMSLRRDHEAAPVLHHRPRQGLSRKRSVLRRSASTGETPKAVL